MIARANIVTEARRWLGTPFRHQGRTAGIGADCGGLVGGVAVACGVVPADWWERTFDPAHGGYGRQPSHGRLRALCESFMSRIVEPDLGDVVLMEFRADRPQHLGIVADYRHGGQSLVHALSSAGRVCEHRFSPAWALRVVACYRMPGVA